MSEREKVMIKKAFRKVVAGIMAGVTAVSLVMSGGNLETAQAATSVSGVSQVSNMPSDFARGVDISAVIAMENSGAAIASCGFWKLQIRKWHWEKMNPRNCIK